MLLQACPRTRDTVTAEIFARHCQTGLTLLCVLRVLDIVLRGLFVTSYYS